RASHALLDHQRADIDVRLVEIVRVRPTEDRAHVAAVGEAARGSREHDLAIGNGWSKHGVYERARVADQSSITADREGAQRVRIAAPGVAVGRGAPEALIRPLEGVLGVYGRDRGGGVRRRIRRRVRLRRGVRWCTGVRRRPRWSGGLERTV